MIDDHWPKGTLAFTLKMLPWRLSSHLKQKIAMGTQPRSSKVFRMITPATFCTGGVMQRQQVRFLLSRACISRQNTSLKMLTRDSRVSRGAKRHQKTQLSCSLTRMRVSLKTGFLARSKYSCLRRFMNLGSSPCRFRICFMFSMQMRSSSVFSFSSKSGCCSSFACITGSSWYTRTQRFWTGLDMILCRYCSSSANFQLYSTEDSPSQAWMVVLPMEEMWDWQGSNLILGANLASESRHSSITEMLIFRSTNPGGTSSNPPKRSNWTASFTYANCPIFALLFFSVRYFSSIRFSRMLVKIRVSISTMASKRSCGQRWLSVYRYSSAGDSTSIRSPRSCWRRSLTASAIMEASPLGICMRWQSAGVRAARASRESHHSPYSLRMKGYMSSRRRLILTAIEHSSVLAKLSFFMLQ